MDSSTELDSEVTRSELATKRRSSVDGCLHRTERRHNIEILEILQWLHILIPDFGDRLFVRVSVSHFRHRGRDNGRETACVPICVCVRLGVSTGENHFENYIKGVAAPWWRGSRVSLQQSVRRGASERTRFITSNLFSSARHQLTSEYSHDNVSLPNSFSVAPSA